MATYDLEEQEKLIELKAWWSRYGNLVFTTIILGVLVVAGVQYWGQHKRSQAAQAGAMYGEMLKAAEAKELKKVSDIGGTLLEQYPRTVYASMGALVSAKAHFDSGDLQTAQAQLQWVTDKARDESMQALARVRLVQVLLDKKAYDEALQVLDAKHPEAFNSHFDEARGDVYVAQAKKAEARTAYESALKHMPEKEKFGRELLQFKIDALGAA